MDFEQYFAGIEPGGLVDPYEIKLLVCYLLSSISEPLTPDQLNFVFQSEGLVNYFSYTSALKGLLETGHIEEVEQGSEKKYKITPLGLDSSHKLQSSLPRSLKDKVVAVALQLLTRLERKKNVDISLKHVEDGYLVECRILDVGSDLMKLTMYANNETQAEIIKRNFEKRVDLLYRTILAVGIGNKDAFGELLEGFDVTD
ncbi:MAG: DUF4364 family protein [Oscillospiraceae bacterium]|nr:DUF4364 family protein [Oscillospiraceae bacterium]